MTSRPLGYEQRNSLESATATFQGALVDSPQAVGYLQGRGIGRDTATQFRLGFVREPLDGFERFVGWISIPYVCAAGHVVGIKFRSLSDDGQRYDIPGGQRTRLFNPAALLATGDIVCVTEGEFDCYSGDTEVLTPSGWVRLDAYSGQAVVEYREGGGLAFVQPSAYLMQSDRTRLHLSTAKRGGVDLIVTPGHRMVSTERDGTGLRIHRADEPPSVRLHVPRVGFLDGPGVAFSDDELRLLLAMSADASFDVRKTDGAQYVRFGFRKERKVRRLLEILDAIGIERSVTALGSGCTSICFRAPNYLWAVKDLPFKWVAQMTSAQRELVLSEMVEWDGNYVKTRNQTEYSTNRVHNAEWMQAIAHTSGRVATLIPRSNPHGYWWKVSILHGKRSTSWQSIKTEEYERGDVYCLTVPSGMLLVRHAQQIAVSGNCMILSQIGLQSVGVPGTNTWKSHHWRMLEGFRRVVLFRDNDEAGTILESELKNTNLPVVVVHPPGGKDVTASYMAGHGDELIGLALGKGHDNSTS